MDPNANLEEQRRCVEIIKKLARSGEDEHELALTGVHLAELVEALDDWISGGGFKPDAWTHRAKGEQRGM